MARNDTAQPLTRLVLASAQFRRGELPPDLYQLAITDFSGQMDEKALDRLALQLSKLDPIGM
jgi:hypothetical protein